MLRTISFVLVLSTAAAAAPAPVVGGTDAPLGAWPDAVAVLANDAMCTGTLIAPDVVLTAGHCIETHPVEVIVDSVELSAPGGEAIKVVKAIAYPDWEHHYDVGVLMLEHPAAPPPRTIASACTASGELAAGASVTVVGFGDTTKAGTGFNTRLHQGTMTVEDPTCTGDPACAPAIAPGGEFTAGGHGHADACFGDSGGPVYIATGKGPVLIGVVSRGVAVPGMPCGNGGVYVRADKVVPWIQKVTGRTTAHATCAGAGDEEDAAPSETGGCDAGGGTGLGAALALLAVRRRRIARRRATQP